MRIEDYHNVWDVTSPADIEAALRKRHGAGRNAFWLFHGSNKSPAISIMVRGDLAYVHYFPKDRHPRAFMIKSFASTRRGFAGV